MTTATVRKGTPTEAFRPRSLDEVIGQTDVKDELRVALAAASARGDMPGHMLFTGPAGTGKTTLALIVASTLGGRLIPLIGPQVRTPANIVHAVMGAQARDVVFIDEIHRVYRPALEFMYTIMEDGIVNDGTLRIVLPPISIVGATTDPERLTTPMLDRFTRILRLQLYTPRELSAIVVKAAQKLGCAFVPEAADLIGRAAEGVPRVALRMMLAARDYAYMEAPMVDMGDGVGRPGGKRLRDATVTIGEGAVRRVLESSAYEWRVEGRDAG